MTAGDCYVLSQSLAIKKKDFKVGRAWMMEAQQKYNKENVSYPFTEVDIHKYLSKVNNVPGNLTTVLSSARPNISEAELIKTYDEKLEFEKESNKETSTDIRKKNSENYEALCRGDLVVPPMVSKSTRISKVAWLLDTDSDVSARIERRIAHMTGLIMGEMGEFQVVNYGIGGYYKSHFDFSTMTDVAQGGATVFPELGVRLLPVKGTAAFWFNLHPSLEGDYAMLHAACPVLQGDKWVCSKFVNKEDQMFTRPCNLEYQEEGFINKIAPPVPKAIS
ncbi:unnamed protein product [Arctia plantaginis]|uniref:Prolyl 4-hydroxylase alpha subunit domain-containing protein n=1 Tax=Arctia plantaginis TaxID=874455 RepID=A0A8S0YZ13_ARCPL|nr:unnamed protein product [Arctia plantaginis]CAB3247910.1 unnamed protein product [Arctia plantaginis]